MPHHKCDILFAGAGLSGLSLAVELAANPAFAEQKIVLIDRDTKTQNDRTWCFWANAEQQATLPPVVHHRWDNIQFYSPSHSKLLQTNGYQYLMIRGIDFYTWAKKELQKNPNVTFVQAAIEGMDSQQGIVQTATDTYEATWILNSALTPFQMMPALEKDHFATPFSSLQRPPVKGFIYLLQHFKGWIIRTPKPCFDPNTATFMDFRVPQEKDTRFVYVLPFSETEALVEFTVFSPELLADEAYIAALKQYIEVFLKIEDYEIVQEEFGVIPMSDFPFSPGPYGREIRIGTAGGFVKPSSGYAFKRTQRRIKAFAEDWANTGHPNPRLLRSGKKFRIYDSVFLRALDDGLIPAHQIFGDFFKNLEGSAVFRFLDEDSSFLEDIRAMNAMPTLPFARAALRQCLRLRHV